MLPELLVHDVDGALKTQKTLKLHKCWMFSLLNHACLCLLCWGCELPVRY